MKKMYWILMLTLSGCTAIPAPTKHAALPIPNYPSPTCNSADDCDLKWTKAMDSIQDLTRMRLRVVTNQYLETFPGMRTPALTGTVTKVPLGNGKYQLRATLTCQFRGLCGDLPERGVQIFNMRIGGTDIVEQPNETVDIVTQ